jgi:hypothetical protein
VASKTVSTHWVRTGVYVATEFQSAKGSIGVANMKGIKIRNSFCKITFSL